MKYPTFDSLTLDLSDFRLMREAESERFWISPDHVGYRVKFDDGPIHWPFDLTSPAVAREFYSQQCEEMNGALLEMKVVTVAGAEALMGLFKYRSPQQGSLGMAFVGILWLPFEDCRFQVNVEGVEIGATGYREAAVMVLEGDRWPMEPQAEIPIVESQEQLDELYRKARLKRLPSDDEKYDSGFPQHPLSLVRSHLARVIATAKLSADCADLRPFRVGDTGNS